MVSDSSCVCICVKTYRERARRLSHVDSMVTRRAFCVRERQLATIILGCSTLYNKWFITVLCRCDNYPLFVNLFLRGSLISGNSTVPKELHTWRNSFATATQDLRSVQYPGSNSGWHFRKLNSCVVGWACALRVYAHAYTLNTS